MKAIHYMNRCNEHQDSHVAACAVRHNVEMIVTNKRDLVTCKSCLLELKYADHGISPCVILREPCNKCTEIQPQLPL